MRKLLFVFLAPLCLCASTIISGNSPLGVLVSAGVSVPLNPNSDPVPFREDRETASWRGTVTVSGGTGEGYLYFYMTAFAEWFNGSGTSEYMESYSSVVWSGGELFTPGWIPLGSTTATCQFCAVSFTFGVPRELHFDGYAYASYSFVPFVPGIPPRLSGSEIDASIWIEALQVATIGPGPYYLAQFDSTQSYSVEFQSVDSISNVPEVSTGWLGILGILWGLGMNRRLCWRRGSDGCERGGGLPGRADR